MAFMLALSAAVFWMSRLAPGDPLRAYYGDAAERLSEQQRENAIERLALGKPVWAQFAAWLKGAVSGDFGISHRHKQSVTALIARAAPNTLSLGSLSLILTLAIATPLGVFCASREGSLADAAILRVGTAASAIPGFFFAILAILVFAVRLRLAPTGGAYSPGGGGLADRAAHLALPVAVTALSNTWHYAALIRARVADELRKDYVLLLRAKRLRESRVLYRHCLRNALPTVIAAAAASAPQMIAGGYVAEAAFNYPGLGKLAFESALFRDYNMLSASALLTGMAVLACSAVGNGLSRLAGKRAQL